MFAKGRRIVEYSDIFNIISDSDILSYYLGIKEIPITISSPLRVDNHPSFMIYSKDGHKVKYYDLARGIGGDTIDLLKQLWNYKYDEVLQKLYDDIPYISKGHKINTSIKGSSTYKRTIYSSRVDLKVKVRDWEEHDISYWSSYGISLPWLKYCRVYPISHIIIIGENYKSIRIAEQYAYVYVEFKDGKESLKVYQPFSQTKKWTNKHDSSVWDLWEQLPDSGENLIITSSRKDAMCVWENTLIPSCSLQAESYLPKEQVISQLKKRFVNIFVLYDNDFSRDTNYGREFGIRLANQFGIKQIEIPDVLQSKDPSDLYYNHGRDILKSTILNLIGKSIN